MSATCQPPAEVLAGGPNAWLAGHEVQVMVARVAFSPGGKNLAVLETNDEEIPDV